MIISSKSPEKTQPSAKITAASHQDRMGVHGMIVFASAKQTFISHIPMFHPPHDMQAVFEITPPKGLELQHGLYSFKPNPFNLDDLVSGKLKTVHGILYRGNFEHDDSPMQELSFDIKNIMRSQALTDLPSKKTLDYLLVGSGRERHLVHLIARHPDFDQIVKVVVDEDIASGITVTFTDRTNVVEERLQLGTFHGQVGGDRAIKIRVTEIISTLTGEHFDKPLDRPSKK